MKILLTAVATAVALGSMSTMAADVDAGETSYNNFGCAGCHGANGISNAPAYPNLAGQKAAYTAKQLVDFASGDRIDPTMNAMAGMVAGQEDDIAAYLETL